MNKIVKIFLIFIAISCNKIEVPKGTPRCIKKEINKMLKDENIELIEVHNIEYDEQSLYCFVLIQNNDSSLIIKNNKCEEFLCYASPPYIYDPSTPNCDAIYEVLTEETIIWED